jgi:hypothetical protein
MKDIPHEQYVPCPLLEHVLKLEASHNLQHCVLAGLYRVVKSSIIVLLLLIAFS